MVWMCAWSYSLSSTCSRWYCRWNDSNPTGSAPPTRIRWDLRRSVTARISALQVLSSMSHKSEFGRWRKGGTSGHVTWRAYVQEEKPSLEFPNIPWYLSAPIRQPPNPGSELSFSHPARHHLSSVSFGFHSTFERIMMRPCNAKSLNLRFISSKSGRCPRNLRWTVVAF